MVVVAGAALVLAAGCATSPDEAVDHGRIELRVEAAANATRVTLAVDDGEPTELVRDATGLFAGSLVIASGAHAVVARAYGDTEIVGQSNPATVQVQIGAVTRATLKVVDAAPASTLGPRLDSLSYPTSVVAGEAASFAISALSPVDAAVAYAWTSSCSEAVFSSQGGTTTWSAPAPGGCTIDVTATSSGISLSRSFVIVVFPASRGGEAVDIDSLHGPRPSLQLDNGCVSMPGLRDGSCPSAVSSPSVLRFGMTAYDWGGSTAGDLQLTDSCGGHISLDTAEPDSIEGSWVPPAAGGPCILLGRAISAEGVIGTSQLSLFAQPGEAYPTTTLWLDATLSSERLHCALSPSTPACGQVVAGAPLELVGDSSDLGLIEIDDSCAGHRRWFGAALGFAVPPWTVPNTPGMSCKVTVRGTSLSGNVKTIATTYKIIH